MNRIIVRRKKMSITKEKAQYKSRQMSKDIRKDDIRELLSDEDKLNKLEEKNNG